MLNINIVLFLPYINLKLIIIRFLSGNEWVKFWSKYCWNIIILIVINFHIIVSIFNTLSYLWAYLLIVGFKVNQWMLVDCFDCNTITNVLLSEWKLLKILNDIDEVFRTRFITWNPIIFVVDVQNLEITIIEFKKKVI